MSEHKKVNMFQFGRLKSLGKKKKSKQKEEVLTITEEYAIINAANNLLYAEDLAKITADVEAMLAISDRWLSLSKFLAFEEEYSKNKAFGFVGSTEESILNGEFRS
jgi:putative IMPACT (imprinted ancient) family translation regulator